MHENTALRALEFLFKTVITFLSLEAILYPFRQMITEAFRGILQGRIPAGFDVSWECTALDEVLLLTSALWWSGRSVKERVRKIMIGATAVEAYNVIRILVLAQFPDRVLHDILFRWGGFFAILGTYYLLSRQEYKHETA